MPRFTAYSLFCSPQTEQSTRTEVTVTTPCAPLSFDSESTALMARTAAGIAGCIITSANISCSAQLSMFLCLEPLAIIAGSTALGYAADVLTELYCETLRDLNELYPIPNVQVVSQNTTSASNLGARTSRLFNNMLETIGDRYEISGETRGSWVDYPPMVIS